MPLEYEIPFETYRLWPRFHASLLNACARSMLHGRHYQQHGKPDTPALALGRVMHFACLQPDVWRAQRFLTDECGRKSKAFEKLVEANPDRICATTDEAAEVDGMCEAIRNHPAAWALLSSPGGVEVSARWTNEHSGLTCKARFDKLADGRIIDLKTTTHAGAFPFTSSALRYGYHRQAAFYLDGYRAVTGESGPEVFTLIAVEKTAPFAVAVYDLTSEELALDQRIMDEWAECQRTGIYPGYSDTSQRMRLPEYLLHYDAPMPTFGGEEIE